MIMKKFFKLKKFILITTIKYCLISMVMSFCPSPVPRPYVHIFFTSFLFQIKKIPHNLECMVKFFLILKDRWEDKGMTDKHIFHCYFLVKCGYY